VAICKDLKIDWINVEREKNFVSSIEKLDFSGNKLNLSDDTFAKWNILNLHSFNLSGNNIGNITKFAFVGFVELMDLDLSRNSLSSIDSKAFENTLNMRVLRLANNRLTEIHPSTFSSFSQLRHLDLSNNSISTIDGVTFFGCADLEWLSLANNRLTALHSPIFQNQSNLSYLDVSGNLITKIEGEVFYYNVKLETLLLVSNNISEFNLSEFRKDNELSHLDESGSRIKELDSLAILRLKTLNLSRNSLQTLRSRSFSNLKQLRNLSLTGNNISEINDEAFCGLENLEYLDLSSNSVKNISLSVFQDMLPQMGTNVSIRTCVPKIRILNLSNNRIHFFNFGGYHTFITTYNISIIFSEIQLLDLSGNCVSLFDDHSVNLLNTSGDLINFRNNLCFYGCSSSQDVYKIVNVTSLNCANQGASGTEKCDISENNGCSTTVNETDMNLKEKGENITTVESVPKSVVRKNSSHVNETKPFLPANILIFGIYASSVFVAVVVVLVITHVVGTPEPDEFWWEDKLAKRNY
jgi:Leucine-rich repeat (LRR) protein